MPSASGTAPPESPVPAPRAKKGAPWALHLLGGAREDDRLRHRPVAREAVALVCAQLRRLREDGVPAQGALEVGDDAHGMRVPRDPGAR